MPQVAMDMFDAALRHHRAGRLAQADQLYRQVLALDPAHADSLHLLGVKEHQLGRHAEAAELIGQAIQVRAGVGPYHSNLGTVRLAQGRYADAASQFERALALGADGPEIHNDLGCAQQAKGDLAAAAASFGRAVSIQPDFTQALYNLGRLLQAQDALEPAALCYERILALAPDNADTHHRLGYLRHAQGLLDVARACLERAIALRPDDAEAHNNLGNVLKDLGDMTGAGAQYDRAIALRPTFAQAHFNRADLKTFRPGDPDLAVLQRLAAEAAPEAEPYARFALAKVLQDIGEDTRGFDQLRLGNAAMRARVDYDEAASEAYFTQTAAVFDGADRPGAGDPSSAPVFIVGMPRSGTTLVEQILASHPQVHAAGEWMNLESIARTALASEASPQQLAACDAQTLRQIGQAYLARLPPLAPGKSRVTDKLPGNFLNIGLIRLILPKARIIHIRRDPADTCLSCFSKLFEHGHAFTYDLGELGRYYRRYHGLMAHWRCVLPPGAMLEVAYEDVVEDLEGQARRLIAYCGLDWDDRCLDFHQTRRPVATASAVQVRQPLYRGSLQRWRRHEAALAPLLAELAGLDD